MPLGLEEGPAHTPSALGGCESSGLVALSSNLWIWVGSYHCFPLLCWECPDGDPRAGSQAVDISRLQTGDTVCFGGPFFLLPRG